MLAVASSAPLLAQTSPNPTRPSDPTTARAWAHLAQVTAQTLKRAAADSTTVPQELAVLPELSFNEFFGPIGPEGLEYSDKIRALAGRRVRVRGFIVQQTERAPGLFLLTGWPVKVDTRADCNETDTPPAMIHVLVPGAEKILPYMPGPRVLSGMLELGPRTEADGRISVARLTLDESARAALFGSPVAVAPSAAQ